MKNETELWNIFAGSGRIEDYLNYRRSVGKAEENHVVEHTGNSCPGTNDSGKRPNDLDFN